MAFQHSFTRRGKTPARLFRTACLALALPAAGFAAETPQQPAAPATTLEEGTVAAQIEADAAAAASQDRVNALVDQRQESANRYAQALAELDSLNQYNAQLQEQVDSQEAEKASIQRQLAEIETTNREVMPLMERMVDTLGRFIEADTPFLLEERRNRVRSLEETLGRADVAISEKYRRILEAYQIELEYGNTLEAYEGLLEAGGNARMVEFVRLGRVTLMYQTLDGAETGYWDDGRRDWVRDDSYREDVTAALSVARQEGAPDLLRVPVPAPQEIAQ